MELPQKEILLYKNSDLKYLMPSLKEAGLGNIVPTSSTTAQLALGDAIAIACMSYKNFTKLDFKKIHPSGSLSIKLKTVGDLMLTGKKIPIVNENIKMERALKIINEKKLGVLLFKNFKGMTTGIITDGDLKELPKNLKNFTI